MNYLLKHIDVTDTETVQTASISNNDRIKIRPDEKVIFLHTGGALGLFDRLKEVEEVLESTSCIEPSSASFRFNTVKKMEL